MWATAEHSRLCAPTAARRADSLHPKLEGMHNCAYTERSTREVFGDLRIWGGLRFGTAPLTSSSLEYPKSHSLISTSYSSMPILMSAFSSLMSRLAIPRPWQNSTATSSCWNRRRHRSSGRHLQSGEATEADGSWKEMQSRGAKESQARGAAQVLGRAAIKECEGEHSTVVRLCTIRRGEVNREVRECTKHLRHQHRSSCRPLRSDVKDRQRRKVRQHQASET